ncbi:hypothetical protein WDU99_03615 [Microbacterium sp. Mu-80]|uniref:Glycosyltransferase family 1 protein n=1 Tax=Microbacterium bandirmense TaxID=3122050 RepID=A0ABU8L9Y5_9MICO
MSILSRANAVGIARAALGFVPDRLLARSMPPSLRWDPDEMGIARPANRSRIRLLITPANSAGQAYRWARAAQSHLADVAAVNLMSATARARLFGFPSDVMVPDSGFVFSGAWQRRQRDVILKEFTHVLLESGQFMYGSRPGSSPRRVADYVRDRGVPVALLWHGSDIRVPSEHASWERDSPFGSRGAYPAEATRVLERNSHDRRRMFSDSGMPVFVSTPGLLDLEGSRWLPVVVDPEIWRVDEAPLQRTRPIVAYAPSNSPMKGDPSIDTQLSELEAEGIIEYRRVQNVPYREMSALYRGSDVVLDQFRLGDYGVAACEAMAAGRIVVGHVHDEVRSRVRELTGMPLPVVESRFHEVGETIRQIAADRAVWSEQGSSGADFVRAVHDGRMAAQALSEFLGAVYQEETR